MKDFMSKLETNNAELKLVCLLDTGRRGVS